MLRVSVSPPALSRTESNRISYGVPLYNRPVIHQPGPSRSVAHGGAGGRAPAPVGGGPPRDLRCSSEPRRTPPPPLAHRRMGARPLAAWARIRPGWERAAVGTGATRRGQPEWAWRLNESPPFRIVGCGHPPCAAQSPSVSGHARRKSRRRDPPTPTHLGPSPRRTLPLFAFPSHSPSSPSPITAIRS